MDVFKCVRVCACVCMCVCVHVYPGVIESSFRCVRIQERNPNFMLICLRGIRDIGRSKFEHSRVCCAASIAFQ